MTRLFGRKSNRETADRRALDLVDQGLCTADGALKLAGPPNRAFVRLFGTLDEGADLGTTVFSSWSEGQRALLREAVAQALSDPEPRLRRWSDGEGTGELLILGPTRADMRYCQLSLARLHEGTSSPVLLQFRDVTEERRLRDDQERQRLLGEEQNRRVRQLLDRERSEVQEFVALFAATVEAAARVVRHWSAEGVASGPPGTLLDEVGRFANRARHLGFTAAADRAGRLEQSVRAVWEEGLELERHLQVVGDYEALAEEKRQFDRVVGRWGDLEAPAVRRRSEELEAGVRQAFSLACGAARQEAVLHYDSDLGSQDPDRHETLLRGLVCLVTNAVQHGLEPAEVRAALGKTSPGRVEVRLRADQTGFRLTVRDDGRGMDWQALRRRLEARGALEPGAPADAVARGVLVGGVGTGLAVVRQTLVKRLGGRISLKSAPGQGVQIEVAVS